MDFNNGAVQTGPQTVTIGGVSATVATLSSLQPGANQGSPDVGIAYAIVPAGTTANINVAYTSAVGSFGDFEVYTLTGQSSNTPTGASSASTGNPGPGTNPIVISSNVATSSGGVIVSMAIVDSSSVPTTTRTGSTETFTDDIDPITVIGSSAGSSSHAVGIATNPASVVQDNLGSPGGNTHAAIASAAWR